MDKVFLVIFFITASVLVTLIMLQPGKSFDGSNSFRTSASGVLFDSSSSTNFMTRMTAILAILFFMSSLVLGTINSDKVSKRNEWKDLSTPAKTKSDKQAAVTTKHACDIPQ